MKTYNFSFIDGCPGDLDILYEQLTMVYKKQEQRTVKEAGEFFKKVQQDAEKYKSIPDKDLGGKIKKALAK
jgi:hypothetical protein